MLQMLLFNLFCRREIEVEVVGFYSVARLLSFIAEMSADRKYFSVGVLRTHFFPKKRKIMSDNEEKSCQIRRTNAQRAKRRWSYFLIWRKVIQQERTVRTCIAHAHSNWI